MVVVLYARFSEFDFAVELFDLLGKLFVLRNQLLFFELGLFFVLFDKLAKFIVLISHLVQLCGDILYFLHKVLIGFGQFLRGGGLKIVTDLLKVCPQKLNFLS